MLKYGAGSRMRVVGGSAGGLRLKGTLSPKARPTTERVRAAIFNILSPGQYEGRRALDLYAGSGSLGIEALSRGAAWADFVERNHRQCQVVRENLEATGFGDAAEVHCKAVESALAGLPGAYALALLDPPYRMAGLDAVMAALADTAGLLAPGAMVVAGHSKRLSLRGSYGPLRLASQRRYGDNAVDFYRREG